MLFLVQVYYTHPGFRTSIFGKNRAYCIRDFTVNVTELHVVSIELLKFHVTRCLPLQSRELGITVVWKEQRQMCALKFLRLEDFLYDRRHGQAVNLEPQGILFADVCDSCAFLDQLHFISPLLQP